MKRFKHSLSHYKLFSCDMGELIPTGIYEVYPGDSVQHGSSALIRVSPLQKPVMHPVVVRLHHWFVPFRLVWQDWEKFITGGSDGEGDGAVHPFWPDGLANPQGSLSDYLGVPPGAAGVMNDISPLPARSYNLIWNEFYRDQDLQAVAPMHTLSGEDGFTQALLQKVCWEKDYFTTARPWPQKGPDVTLPLGTSATVTGTIVGDGSAPSFANAGAGVTARDLRFKSADSDAAWDPAAPGANADALWSDPHLDFTGGIADLSTATAVNVNDVRRAFALQRYQEARAMYGSRYTEYLRYLGVRSSDARLQRPEYLGGGKQTIAFSEILQTAPTTSGVPDTGVGELKGHGIAAVRSNRFRRFFEEHGYVLTLMSVRPRTMYVTGCPRIFKRVTKEDYWQKELEQIGQQEVLKGELYCTGAAADNEVFGYQDRYAELRHVQSSVAGDFRTTENDWHLARIFAAHPTLNATFVSCEPSKRIHQVQTEDVLWCMVHHSIQARRMIRRSTVGRII